MDCVGGACEEAEGFCQRNGDCADGQECSRETLRCIVPQCGSNGDCAQGETCTGGRCAAVGPEDVGPEDVGPDEPDVDEKDTSDAEPDDVAPDVTPDIAEDAAPDVAEDAAPDDAEDAAPDVLEDAVDDAVADVAADVAEDVPPDVSPDVVEDTGPPPTPDRGLYRYTPIPVGRLAESVRVAFHPSGDYFVVVERTNVLHVIDWATKADTRIDLKPGGDNFYWKDFSFDPTGRFALLVGHRVGNAPTAVVFRFEDAAWRAWSGDPAPVVHELIDARRAEVFSSVAWPWGSGLPIIQGNNYLGSGNLNNPILYLRDFDPEAGAFGSFTAARNSSSPCDEATWAKDQYGNPGILVACGTNGADVLFYHWVGGVGEWVVDPGNNNLGNTSRLAAYPGGDYALVVSWSGDAIYRFQLGSLNSDSEAARFSRNRLWGVRFQQEGQRALIFGGTSQTPLIASVFEYRHDLYRCPSTADCDLTEVSISNFAQAPFLGTSTTHLNDAGFRPGCDGGVIVGGRSDFQSSTGLVVQFQIQGARACD